MTADDDGVTTHANTAAYVLGVLSESEQATFEEHLRTCEQCQRELDSLMPVTDLLADVDMFAPVIVRHREAVERGWVAKVLGRLRRPTRARAAVGAARDLRDEVRRFEREAARFTGELAAALRASVPVDRELS